jgi:hypothetical protein
MGSSEPVRHDGVEEVWEMSIGRGKSLGLVVAVVFAMAIQGFAAVDVSMETDSERKALNKSSVIYVNGYEFDCLKGEPAIWEGLSAIPPAPGNLGLYIVHAKGQIEQRWVDTINSLGIEVVSYLPNYAYEVRMTPEQAMLAEALPFVDWVGQYHPAYKVSPDITCSELTITFAGNSIPKAAIESVRSQMSIWEEGETTSGYIMNGVLAVPDGLPRIAASPYVQYIAPYLENQLFDEAGSQIIGGYLWYQDPDGNTNTPYRGSGTHGGYANQIGYDGAGITVGIADTGLGDGTTPNAGHNDFTGRVIGGMSYAAGAWSDGHGHGTHCAGLMAADSFEGNGVTYAGYGPYYAAEGLAQESSIYAQKIFTDGGSFIGPADDGQILVDGYSGGARIHTNSCIR